MTPTPSWLYYFFAVAMLAVAAYGLVLLAVSVAIRRAAGWDVDVAHIFMGVSMAGMFVADWAFGPSAIWELIFTALLVWFLVQSVQSVIAFGIHLTHYLIHAAMSFAMLLMYVVPAGARSGTMSMSMSRRRRAGGSIPGSACCWPSRSSRPPSSRWPRRSRVPPITAGTSGPTPAIRGPAGRWKQSAGGSSPRPAARRSELIADPRLEDASHVVMAVGMAFLMILLI